jgi:hypothetical protein
MALIKLIKSIRFCLIHSIPPFVFGGARNWATPGVIHELVMFSAALRLRPTTG